MTVSARRPADTTIAAKGGAPAVEATDDALENDLSRRGIDVPPLSVDEVPSQHAHVFKLTGVE